MNETPVTIEDACAKALDFKLPGSAGPSGPSLFLGDNREPCPDVSECCHARVRAPSTAEILRTGHQMRCCGCGKAV